MFVLVCAFCVLLSRLGCNQYFFSFVAFVVEVATKAVAISAVLLSYLICFVVPIVLATVSRSKRLRVNFFVHFGGFSCS